MRKDIDYVVKDGEVIIVDESTGRLMYGRRYNEGLHQAIELRKALRLSVKAKLLLLSHSRTTSVCIKSSLV